MLCALCVLFSHTIETNDIAVCCTHAHIQLDWLIKYKIAKWICFGKAIGAATNKKM